MATEIVEGKPGNFPSERRVLFPFERELRDVLISHSGELYSRDEISQAIWRIPLNSSRREVIRMGLIGLRLNPKEYFYTVRGFGVFHSSENLEGTSVGLRDIGVSLFLEEKDRRKVVPGLSVLSPKVLENQKINHKSVEDLVDKLVWMQSKEGRMLLKPYLTSLERQLLACSAKGGICSKDQLMQVTGIKTELNLRRHLSFLRKKITDPNLWITAEHGRGYLLEG